MKVITVLGTRPELIKLSPLIPLLDKEFEHILVHTGQHYDYEMDSLFFEDLELRKPDYNLGVGSGLQGKQAGLMLEKLEKIIIDEKADLVIAFGDTNTTLAGSLAASKLHIKLAHIEAGCRSFNKKMPEEINRIVSDHVSDYLFPIDYVSNQNLLNEGIPKEKIFLVGSLIIDACLRNKDLITKSKILDKLNLKKGNFVLVTTHRAENTNNVENMKNIFEALEEISKDIDIVLPIHPTTKNFLKQRDIKVGEKVKLIDPVGYIDFLNLLINSRFVMTDSGGVQEESVILNKPCLVIRNETELTGYVKPGKLILTGTSKQGILDKAKKLVSDDKEIERISSIKIDLYKDVAKNILDILKRI